MFRLNVIGGGRIGKTLGLLWRRAGIAEVQDVLCTQDASARAAVAIIGAGRPLASCEEVRPADVHLIAVPDDALGVVVKQLAETVDLADSVVFHTSGWMTSSALLSAAEKGASVASVHPIKSFAEPLTAADSFAGTWCGVEGEVAALRVLRPAFEQVGASLVDVEAGAKPLYHTATVISSNYVVALTALAQRSLAASGVDADRAMQMLIPLLRGTVDNLARLGPVDALTGPIRRGDGSTVTAHLEALTAWDPAAANTYRDQAARVVELARSGGTPEDALARVVAVLRSFDLESDAGDRRVDSGNGE